MGHSRASRAPGQGEKGRFSQFLQALSTQTSRDESARNSREINHIAETLKVISQLERSRASGRARIELANQVGNRLQGSDRGSARDHWDIGPSLKPFFTQEGGFTVDKRTEKRLVAMVQPNIAAALGSSIKLRKAHPMLNRDEDRPYLIAQVTIIAVSTLIAKIGVFIAGVAI
jgi:hypothetical protein